MIDKDKGHLLFKQNTYLIKTVNKDTIFAQRRSIFLNAFTEYNVQFQSRTLYIELPKMNLYVQN